MEPSFEAEPESWRPPARCPQCRTTQTRFIRMEYEASVYECEVCGIEFEAEE
jgi:rubredoxin